MKNVVIKKLKLDRKGVFAARDIKKGEVILDWHPKAIISKKELLKLPKDEQNHTTPIGQGRYVVMGSPERYINHSCDPNDIIYNQQEIAIKNIKKGEEITSDYSINEMSDWEMKCNCGSKNCRKIVRGNFFQLPKKLQKKYHKYLEDWFIKEYINKKI